MDTKLPIALGAVQCRVEVDANAAAKSAAPIVAVALGDATPFEGVKARCEASPVVQKVVSDAAERSRNAQAKFSAMGDAIQARLGLK
jgi:hypothetical protein